MTVAPNTYKRKTILDSHAKNPIDGYRCLTFVMLMSPQSIMF